MKKKYKVSLITLFAAVLSAVLIAVCLLTSRVTAVYAADRYVTVDGNNVFYTAIRGAEVVAEKVTIKGNDDKDEDHYYTTFKLGKDETVSYRKSLAYEWRTGEFDDKGNPTGAYEVKHFNMTIGFPSLNFTKFIIKFQSQQYLNNKDNISENYLVFAKQDGDKLGIAAVQSLEDEITSYPVSCDFESNSRIQIAFDKFEQGKVSLKITAAGATGGELAFENVYFPYASYVSSGDNAVTPLTFSAELEDEQGTADMRLYDLNGQSFEMYAHDNDGIYNDVKDTAPPVLCFTKTPSYVEFGKTLNFSYQVLDVLASSPRTTPCFYVLTGEQYAANDFNYSQIVYEESSSKEETDKKEYEYPFTKVNTGSDIRVIRDDKTFVPAEYLEDSNVYGLIKVYFEISDITDSGTSSSTAKKDRVFLEWYANEDALVDIYGEGYKQSADNKHEYFLKIIDGKSGATYAQGDTSLESYKQTIKKIEKAYQDKIKEAIENLEDGKLYAGGDNKFYLPALDELISGDEYCNLRDYKYSLYYRAKSTGSNTSLDYNKLAISLSEADVTYRFTIFVTDAFGNPMRYPTGLDENGEVIWEEIKAEDVWKEDFADLLPFFEFDVSYKAATAENPDSLSVAYVGTAYSGVSFDIKGVSDTYTAKYNLYIFNRNAAYNEIDLNLTYSEFEENFEKLFNNEYKEGVNTRKYFLTVKPSSELKDADEHYDLFKKIGWNATNVSFTPQTAEDFYIVRLTLTDNRSQQSTTHFATVAASIQANSLKGESEWVQNNVAAIVLLCVAGVLFIAFIVLLVVKPKDKGDIDEIYENDKKSGKKKVNK